MEGLLAGKVVLVTGAANEEGIGHAIARLCAEQGARVAITSRSAESAKKAAATIPHATGHACELTDDASATALAREVLRAHGRLDGLVHNAGVPVQEWERAFADVPMAAFQKAFDVDVLGGARLVQAFLPALKERGGSIVFTSSTPALAGYEHLHEFSPAKAAVLGITKGLAAELGRHQIRANAVAYGNIRTPPTWDALTQEQRQALADEAPLRRWGTPREAAGASVFLLSDLSSFITGQTLIIDGGTVMR